MILNMTRFQYTSSIRKSNPRIEMHVYGPRRFSLCKKIPNLKSMIAMFGEFFLANKVGTHLVYLYGIMTD